MLKIALVEDQVFQRDDIISKTKEFFNALNRTDYEIKHFESGEDFIVNFEKGAFNAIFMDIEMPGRSGLEIAKILREKDSNVPLIFITVMAQFALKGYEVDAIDYLVKPVQKTRFDAMMTKLLRRYDSEKKQTIQVKVNHETRFIDIDTIYYIEISGHMISIFTDEEIIAWGTLSNLLAELPSDRFVRCNNNAIINIAKVSGVKGNDIFLDKYKVAMSRPRKKETVIAIVNYQKLR